MSLSAENLWHTAPGPLDVAVLVLPDSNLLSLAAAVDPMRAANRRAGRALFRWAYYSLDSSGAELTAGFTLPAQPVADLDRTQLLMVIAGFNLHRHASPALLASLRRLAPRCLAVAGVDGGSQVMAMAGLLDGHMATTHWEDRDQFAATFDRVSLRPDRFVVSGNRLTAGGAAPTIDMMLHLIALRHGADLSARVAGALIYDPGPAGTAPQALTATARLARRHPVVARAVALMEAHLDEPLRVATLAQRLRLSLRHLETLFQRALGQSPKQFYLALRLSEARRMAQDSPLSVAEIAQATGFSGQSAFSRAFARHFGISVRDLRAQSQPQPQAQPQSQSQPAPPTPGSAPN